MVAVHGGGYCSSAVLAAKTVLANFLRVAGVDTFAVLLIWLGKVFTKREGYILRDKVIGVPI